MKKVLLIAFVSLLAFTANAQLRVGWNYNVSVGNCQPLTNARLNVGAPTQPTNTK